MARLEVYTSPIDGLNVFYNPELSLKPDVVTDALAFHASTYVEDDGEPLGIYELGMGSAPFLSLLAQRVPSTRPINILGVDISEEARTIAEINLAYTLENRGNDSDACTVIPQSWTDMAVLLDGFDVGYFNPPYLPIGEAVRAEWESAPSISMYVEGSDDGLDHYRWLLPRTQRFIAPDGHIYIRTPRDFEKYSSVKRFGSTVLGQDCVQPVIVQSEGEKREGRALIISPEAHVNTTNPHIIEVGETATRIFVSRVLSETPNQAVAV